MSIHKLSAGSGYDYLTRQVAALDATEKGHVGASYYTERGFLLSPLTTGTCPQSLWRKNGTCRTSQTTTGNSPGGTP
jgi:hypothetical protein